MSYRSLPRCLAFVAFSACLISAVNAQTAQIIVPAANITASANDGNLPANTVDNNLATRWSASGDPQWIRFDMGAIKTVDYLKIAFYNGDERRAKFDVQVSDTGTTWTTVATNVQSSGVSLALETFDIADATGRYVRINGHGTDTDLWNSYTEVQIWGYTGSPPVKLAVSSVTNSTNDGNVAANAIDGNLATRWSASGDPQWIKFNLGSSATIAYVKMAFYKGDERSARFDVATSTNDSTYTTVLTNKTSSGTSLALETFEFADGTGQYVKITGHGTNTDAWNSYTEVEIWGFPGTAQTPPIPTGLAANAVSSTQINVSWNSSVGATGYDLMVDANIVDVGAATSYQHTGLVASSSHTYQVRAKNATGTSPFSTAVSATTLNASAPATPTGLTATAVSNSQINLAWNASTGATSYDIERDGVALNVGTSLTNSHTGLAASSTHNYRVRANNANGSSAWSAIVSATTQGGSSIDPLGIKKLYADSTRSTKAADWYMGISGTSRLSGWSSIGSFSGSGVNTVYTRNTNLSSNIRMSIYAEDTLSSCDTAIVDNKTTLMSRLYMYKPSDWRNIEFTGYFKLDSGGNDTMGAYTHGASHSDCSCHGTAYKGDFMYSNGGTKINKEIFHGGPNVYRTVTTQNVGSQLNKWFGYKFIVYNLPQNGTYSGTSVPRIPVKIEVWMDINLDANGTPLNNWIKVGETTDLGDNWGSTSTNCGGKDFWTMPWGGPNVTIRIDKDSNNTPYGHFILHHCSLREIDPIPLP
ncbi:MAG TPA: discoidin domain-containing protein [Opitutaceae bacterium]|nr:discoidin domain-containing protein [Opitutaceae bacterium]